MPVSPLPWRIVKDRDTTCVMDATNNRVMDNESYYPVHVDVDDMALVVEAVSVLAWLQTMHTLHKAVEALYVVDGYEVTITWDSEQIAGPYKADTLREAYVQAMRDERLSTDPKRIWK